ncbi:MAG TPA: CGNR zinc finger domain-containing protein, partial [Longimicrobiales bacterium]|nr:CGNR zinc finger domain-containing protein [Longimicrobiales bacterium]
LAPLARAAVELLGEAPPERLKRCDAPDCRLWFVDESKGGRRRWCSMARCGNRAKAARHRRRERAAGRATAH